MAVPDRLATEYGLFLKATAPSDAFDSSEYSEALYIRNLALNGTRDAVDATSRNSPLNGFAREFVAGKFAYQLTFDGIYDIVEETGQQVGFDAFNGTTQAAAKTWFLLTTDTSGDQEASGAGFFTSWNITLNDGDNPLFSAGFQPTGQVSYQVVP